MMKRLTLIAALLIASMMGNVYGAFPVIKKVDDNIYQCTLALMPKFGNESFSWTPVFLASPYTANLLIFYGEDTNWQLPQSNDVTIFFQAPFNETLKFKTCQNSDNIIDLGLNFGMLSSWKVNYMKEPINDIIAHSMAVLATYDISSIRVNDKFIRDTPSPAEFRAMFDKFLETVPNAGFAAPYRRLMANVGAPIERSVSSGMPSGDLNVADLSETVLGFKPEAGHAYLPYDVADGARRTKGWNIANLSDGAYGFKANNLKNATIARLPIKELKTYPSIQNETFLSDVTAKVLYTPAQLDHLINTIRKQFAAAGWTDDGSESQRLYFHKGNTMVECWWGSETDSDTGLQIFTINAQKFQSIEIVRLRLENGLG